MSNYVVKRLLLFIPMLLGVTVITFFFIHLAPGDFLDTLKLNPQISPQVIADYSAKFHLDKPLYQQYFIWLKNILKGDLGYSFAYRAPVVKVVASRALNTLILSVSAMLLTWLLVIPLGVLSALNKDRWFDKIVSRAASIGMALPSFFLAFILLTLATFSGLLPLGGMHSIDYDRLSPLARFWDLARHLVIPALVLSIPAICTLQKIMRANMLEALGAHYVVSARARGISRWRIVFIHALKNALNPMITIFGYQFSDLLSGAALTEIIIGWPGLGVVMLDAVRCQDIYLVMGAVVMGSLMLIIGNLLADLALSSADPRIRYER